MSENFKFQAPYRFVPYSKQVLVPSWGDKVSHDLPFSDGEDGTIVLSWKNLTPICVSEGKVSEGWCNPCSVTDPEGKRHYYLPGTSIKGMIQSVMENMCMTWFDRYNDDFMGFREVGNRRSSYAKRMKGQHCGWLQMLDDDSYRVTEVSGEPQAISYEELERCEKSREDCLNLLLSVEGFSKKSFDERYPVVTDDGRRLVCTGDMANKKHQYLFGDDTEKTYSVGDAFFKDFCSVYKPSPYYDALLELLKKRERVAVFYQVDGRGGVKSMGLTKMYRLSYRHSVSSGVSQSGFDEYGNKVDRGMDLVQTIFGSIAQRYGEPLKGRVQVGHAMAVGSLQDPLVDVEGVLGGPSASFYPFYLMQSKGSSWNTYDTESGITLSGRKRYPVHGRLTELPVGNGNEKVMTKIRMIPAGQEFAMKIHLHNLRPVEIGALLSAISFHQVKGCYHSLGLGKPYGYGKLCLNGLKLEGLEYETEDYLREFEILMQAFCDQVKKQDWICCTEMKSLLNYASDHDDVSQLGVMTLDEYGDVKKSRTTEVFPEKDIPFFSKLEYMDSLAEVKSDIEERRIAARKCVEMKELEKLSAQIEDMLSSDADDAAFSNAERVIAETDLPHLQDEKDKLLNDVQERYNSFQEQRRLKEAAEAERKREERAADGLAILMKQKEDGAFLVKDFRRGRDEVNKWLRASSLQKVPKDEYDRLKSYLERQYSSDIRGRDKKKWDYADKYSYWRDVAGWIDEETAKRWAEEFKIKP